MGHTSRLLPPCFLVICFLVPIASWVEATSYSLSPRASWWDIWVRPPTPAHAPWTGSSSRLGEEKRNGWVASRGHPGSQGRPGYAETEVQQLCPAPCSHLGALKAAPDAVERARAWRST